MTFATFTLRQKVRVALKQAAENGYYFEGASAEQIAEDMVTYCEDMERENLRDVVDAVRFVRAPKLP